MSYITIDNLRDLTPNQMNGAKELNFIPYVDNGNGPYTPKWDLIAVTDNNVSAGNLYYFYAIEGSSYDILSGSDAEPDLLIVFDNLGNAIEANKEADDPAPYHNTVFFDAIGKWVAPYTGKYYVDPSWKGPYNIDVLQIRKYIDVDLTPPIILTFNPTDGSSTASINENITLTFNEPIQKGTGTIQIRTDSANGKVIESFDAAISPNISISDHSLIIDPTQSLSYNTHYFVTLASGTVEDLAGNNYQGTTTYDFTTTNTVTTALSSYTLSTKEPNDLTYIGSSDFAGTGTIKNNIITSSIGNDKLDGGKGTDTLIGGKGNDTYILDSIKDIVVEEANSGIDTIQSSVTFSLAALVNVENLTLIGTKAINGTGNNLDNTILGNSAKNVINGGLGNDILTGGNSADTFQFNTALNSSTNVDTITDFVHGTDKIQLSRSIMSSLNSGTKLNPLDFALSTAVLDASDRIIYDQSSGALYYDADGSGAVAAIQIAIIGVETHATLTPTDFILAK